jgi:site-specific recombinase XerD
MLFITRGGKPVDAANIHKELKKLAAVSRVNPKKVFPHNFRHFFALCYYKRTRDIDRLAYLLGHGSVNTTRIYTADTQTNIRRELNRYAIPIAV